MRAQAQRLLCDRGWLLAWLALVVAAQWQPGPLPLDETRYLSVAWEMWARADWLVPHLNGAPYSDKPPLLFWSIQAGWALFGVNEWWPRLVPSLFALLGLYLTRGLARRLWPQHDWIALAAPWVLASTQLWTHWMTRVMFDMLLSTFVLMAVYGLVLASQGRRRVGWTLVALGCGLGLLAKGPAMLLPILSVGLLGPWWSDMARTEPHAWFGRCLAAVLVGDALALAWALPAAASGGAA